jgi:hypothetical protein
MATQYFSSREQTRLGGHDSLFGFGEGLCCVSAPWTHTMLKRIKPGKMSLLGDRMRNVEL